MDRRTDVYSLGVTLYEMLTLRRPFPGPRDATTVRRVLDDGPPDARRWNPAVGSELAAIVQMALETDPKRRYASAAMLAAELRAFRDGRPVRARAAPWPLRAWRPIHRRWPGATPLVLTVALLSVAAAFLLHGREPLRAPAVGYWTTVQAAVLAVEVSPPTR